MNLDLGQIGAVAGGVGVIITALGGVYVATRTNTTEKQDSAKKALEETRDEAYEARLALKDDKIAFLEERLKNCELDNKLRIEELEAENDKLRVKIEELKGV